MRNSPSNPNLQKKKKKEKKKKKKKSRNWSNVAEAFNLVKVGACASSRVFNAIVQTAQQGNEPRVLGRKARLSFAWGGLHDASRLVVGHIKAVLHGHCLTVTLSLQN